MKSRINGPTWLTLLRIVLVAPLMVSLFVDALPAKIIATTCFVVASLTDFVDGWWARKAGLVTDLGKFLDPLADKMLVNLTFLAFVSMGLMPLWMFAVILVRDFAVDGVRMLAAGRRITIAASIFGKAKTMMQMITVTLILINSIVRSETLGYVGLGLLYVVVALTVWSGVDYLIKGRKLFS